MSKWLYRGALSATIRGALLFSLGYSVPTLLQTRTSDKIQPVAVSEPSHSLDESIEIFLQQNKAVSGISNIAAIQELRMLPDRNLGNFAVEFYPEGYFNIDMKVPIPLTVGYVAHAYNSKVKIENPPNPYDKIEMDNFIRSGSWDAVKMIPQYHILGGIKYSYDVNNKNLISATIRRDKQNGVNPLLIVEAMGAIANKIAENLVESPSQTKNNSNRRAYNLSLALKNNLNSPF